MRDTGVGHRQASLSRARRALPRILFGSPAVHGASLPDASWTRSFASPDYSGFAFVGVILEDERLHIWITTADSLRYIAKMPVSLHGRRA